MLKTKTLFRSAVPAALLVELAFAAKLYQRWAELKHDGFAGAYQAAGALLIGWPTVVFALAATWAAFRSADSSERQAIAADRQAVAADDQALAARAQTKIAEAQLRESVRPVLVVDKVPDRGKWQGVLTPLYLKNTGSGTALSIQYWFHVRRNGVVLEVPGPNDLDFLSLPPSATTGLLKADLPEHDDAEVTGIELTYTDTLGNHLYTRFMLHDHFEPGVTALYAERWPDKRSRDKV